MYQPKKKGKQVERKKMITKNYDISIQKELYENLHAFEIFTAGTQILIYENYSYEH